MRKETEPVKKVKVMNAPEVMSVKFLVEEIRLEDFVVFGGGKWGGGMAFEWRLKSV